MAAHPAYSLYFFRSVFDLKGINMERIFAIIVGLSIGFFGSHAFLGEDKRPETQIVSSVPLPQVILQDRQPQAVMPECRPIYKPMGVCNRLGRFVFGSHRNGEVGIFRRIGRFFFGKH